MPPTRQNSFLDATTKLSTKLDSFVASAVCIGLKCACADKFPCCVHWLQWMRLLVKYLTDEAHHCWFSEFHFSSYSNIELNHILLFCILLNFLCSTASCSGLRQQPDFDV